MRIKSHQPAALFQNAEVHSPPASRTLGFRYLQLSLSNLIASKPSKDPPRLHSLDLLPVLLKSSGWTLARLLGEDYCEQYYNQNCSGIPNPPTLSFSPEENLQCLPYNANQL